MSYNRVAVVTGFLCNWKGLVMLWRILVSGILLGLLMVLEGCAMKIALPKELDAKFVCGFEIKQTEDTTEASYVEITPMPLAEAIGVFIGQRQTQLEVIESKLVDDAG